MNNQDCGQPFPNIQGGQEKGTVTTAGLDSERQGIEWPCGIGDHEGCARQAQLRRGNESYCPCPHHATVEHPYLVHAINCTDCSGPNGRCAEGLRLLREDSATVSEATALVPCPFCKAVPQPCGHYWEVIHTSECFFAELYSDNTRTIIIKNQVDRWNARPTPSIQDKLDLVEIEAVLSLLMSYGKVNEVVGVRYPEGSHRNAIERAENLLLELRKRIKVNG